MICIEILKECVIFKEQLGIVIKALVSVCTLDSNII